MQFAELLSSSMRETFLNLASPLEIQRFLDTLPYKNVELNRSPLQVLQDGQCHCLDGGMLGALALRQIGFPPLLVELEPEWPMDDDHVIAVFKVQGYYGALAKSNFAGLRYREPVYRTLRELVISYFELFFNVDGVRTMRGYSRPLNLARFDRYDWATTQAGVERVVKHFYAMPTLPIVTPERVAGFTQVDALTYRAGTVGTDFEGVFRQK